MRAILIGVLISLGVSSSASGKLLRDPSILAEQAAAEFESGLRNKSRILLARKHFNAAADAYLTLHARGNCNAELYRCLGNALVLADRWPEAIWAYQSGLTIAPGDGTMRRHLADLRTKVLLPPDGRGRIPSDRWPLWMPCLTVRTCWWLVVGSYLLLCIAVSAWRIDRTRRWIGLGVAATSAVILFTIALWAAENRERFGRETSIAVVIENTPFRKGNGDAYPPHAILATLPRGLESRVLHQRSGWLQVALSTGEIGWIRSTATRIVQP